MTTNTTIFKGADPDDLHELFRRLTRAGVEGIMLAPGYNYAAVDRSAEEHFLERKESKEVFQEILDPDKVEIFRFTILLCIWISFAAKPNSNAMPGLLPLIPCGDGESRVTC